MNIFGYDGDVKVFHPDKPYDVNAILRTIAFLISQSNGICMKKSIHTLQKEGIYSQKTSADIDSLIFTYANLDSTFRLFFGDMIRRARQNEYSFYDGLEYFAESNSNGPGAKTEDSLDLNARLLVDLVFTNGAITEKTQIVKFLDPYIPVGPKCRSAKPPTIGYSMRCKHLFTLPPITTSEPCHAFILMKNIEDFRMCVIVSV